MVDEFAQVISLLQTSGPFAILVFLGYAYWKQNSYIQKLHSQILESSIANVQAMTEMSKAIDGLKDALNSLNARM